MIITTTKASKFVEGNALDDLKVKVGDKIEIIEMKGEPNYTGKTGQVTSVDDIGQIHGTWGGCALIPNEDSFKIIRGE